MMRRSYILGLIAALALSALASGADAAACRDPKTGKFIKCPPPAAAKHCRDIKTKKFAKCGAPGTEPVPAH
jgi:hypothetical protein